MTTSVIAQRVLPDNKVILGALVVVFAGLTALAAQWVIPLPFTPVPITGQTFAVLMSGAVLGSRAGAASQVLYLAVGAAGLPVFAEQSGGREVLIGPTGGYIVGFVFAAALVGLLAESRHDRQFSTMLTAFLAGSAVIYFFGVIGLMQSMEFGVNEAIAKGVVPFVFGDLIKATAAGLLVPGAWRMLGER